MRAGTIGRTDVVGVQRETALETITTSAAITGLVWSRDGRRLAVGSTLGLHVLDGTTLAERLVVQAGPVIALAAVPGGDQVACLLPGGRVRVGAVDGCGESMLVDTGLGTVHGLAVAADGRRLVVAGTDGNGPAVLLCGLRDHQDVERLVLPVTGSVRAVAVSPDGLLATGHGDGMVVLWRDGGDGYRPAAHLDTGAVHLDAGLDPTLLRFDAAGRRLVTGEEGGHGRLLVWWLPALDVADAGQPVGTAVWQQDPAGHGHGAVTLDHGRHEWVRDVAAAVDGRLLVTAAGRTVRLWDLPAGRRLAELHPDAPVRAAAFSPDTAVLAVGTETSVELWPVHDQESGPARTRRTFAGGWTEATCGGFRPDGEVLAVGSHDGLVRLWRTGDGHLLRVLDGTQDPRGDSQFHTVTWSADGELVAATGAHDLFVWAADSGEFVYQSAGFGGAAAFGPGGWLLAVARIGHVTVHDLAAGTVIGELPCADGAGWNGLAFSSDGRLLAVDTGKGQLSLWSASERSLLRTDVPQGPDGHRALTGVVGFTPDGRSVAVTTDGGRLRVLRTQDLSLRGGLPAAGMWEGNGWTVTGGDTVVTGRGAWRLPSGEPVAAPGVEQPEGRPRWERPRVLDLDRHGRRLAVADGWEVRFVPLP